MNSLVRSVVEQTLTDEFWVEAEISEARLASNGHFYIEFIQKAEEFPFSLPTGEGRGGTIIARARGTCWARTYSALASIFEQATGERLRAGIKVRVLVRVVFHELYGYSLNVTNIDPVYTLGDIAQRRRHILAQLKNDGIADDNRQLPLPRLLRRIAVISSPTAAGYGDFSNQLAHNDYGLHFDVQLFPAVMQGANVEESVLAALQAVMAEADCWDCVVIIRGGGATSDLTDFDTYPLAAAVAQMPLPVIVGIGHERDETVLDLVAHTHVKTPTAAAALLIEHGATELATLDDYLVRIVNCTRMRIDSNRQRLSHTTVQLPHIFALVQERQQHRLHVLHERMRYAVTANLQNAKMRVEALRQRIAALDPAIQLRRGYALTYTPEGHLVRSVDDLSSSDTIVTRLADGKVTSLVLDVSR